MKFWKPNIVGIIGGKGRMGQWFARFFKSHGYTVLVSDNGTRLTNAALVQQCDVVVFSVPIPGTTRVIRSVVPHVGKEQLLLDLCSLKKIAVKTMLESTAHVIGMHPLFGPFSRSMNGKTIILCPVRADSSRREWLLNLLAHEKALVQTMTPSEHDKAMAITQMLTHLRNFVFAETIKNLGMRSDTFLELSSPPSRIEFDCMGRILSQNLDMYAAIATHNPYRKRVLTAYRNAFEKCAHEIQSGDTEKFEHSLTLLAKHFRHIAPVCQRESDLLIEYLHHISHE